MNTNSQSAEVYTPEMREHVVNIFLKDPSKRTEDDFLKTKRLLLTFEAFSKHRTPALRKVFGQATVIKTAEKAIIMSSKYRQGDHSFVLLEGNRIFIRKLQLLHLGPNKANHQGSPSSWRPYFGDPLSQTASQTR
jgi:hypothetical protein